jgi:hypothetical protein
MSALPPRADIKSDGGHVRFVPKADIRAAAKSNAIRSPRRRGREHDWDCETERLGGLHFDDEFDFRRLVHWQVRRVLALEEAASRRCL